MYPFDFGSIFSTQLLSVAIFAPDHAQIYKSDFLKLDIQGVNMFRQIVIPLANVHWTCAFMECATGTNRNSHLQMLVHEMFV